MNDVIELRVLLERIAKNHPTVALASSLSAEDMLLTHIIAETKIPITIFTLNTGMLHAETISLLQKIKIRYGINVDVFEPQTFAVDDYVKSVGKFGFYESLDNRKRCCNIRKVEPLQRALNGRTAWITGQRQAQSTTRDRLEIEAFDASNQMQKFNPLATWGDEAVWAYIRDRHVPYNPLHDKGYPSIGCEPCTRAIRPGEDPRAGRWWWESSDSKECGLHAGNLNLQTQRIIPIVDHQTQ